MASGPAGPGGSPPRKTAAAPDAPLHTADTLHTPLDPTREYVLYCDGASRGNPGPAAIGFVLLDAEGRELLCHGERLGDRLTNNVAEYTALVRGLEAALACGVRRLRVRMDSELVVRQMLGAYKVRHAGLQQLHASVRQHLQELQSFRIEHVPRAENARADALANAALDA